MEIVLGFFGFVSCRPWASFWFFAKLAEKSNFFLLQDSLRSRWVLRCPHVDLGVLSGVRNLLWVINNFVHKALLLAFFLGIILKHMLHGQAVLLGLLGYRVASHTELTECLPRVPLSNLCERHTLVIGHEIVGLDRRWPPPLDGSGWVDSSRSLLLRAGEAPIGNV